MRTAKTSVDGHTTSDIDEDPDPSNGVLTCPGINIALQAKWGIIEAFYNPRLHAEHVCQLVQNEL